MNGAPPEGYVEILDELLKAAAQGHPNGADFLNDSTVQARADLLKRLHQFAARSFEKALENSNLGVPLEAKVWRGIHARWMASPLGVAGSELNDGRFHRTPDPTYYFSLDPDTVHHELKSRKTYRPTALVPVEVCLLNVIDLTDPKVCSQSKISTVNLQQEWLFLNDVLEADAYSQLIGKLARRYLYEGLIVKSARCDGKNLIVFQDALKQGSSLRVIDADGDLADKVRREDMYYEGLL